MPYTDFHYTPTGTGVISGKEVLEQTEDAINDLGGQISGDVQTAIDTANNALNTANTASADAQNAVNTANTAYTAATNAQNTANAAQNTASNALTAAQNAQNDVNALGNRVTTAENNITQNTTDISGLTTRMGTAEGNITNLQNDVVTAQGTATSAQNTATMARQQSYVFRYSSTALTPSSTNSNALLDNTDNLKVGDKVIDSNGVLFSITAIDTANSTFTIGTALIDLAQDSDVVHKSGNETVGGEKTFTGALTASRNVANGEIILQNASYDPKTNGQGGVSTKSFSVNFVTALSDTFGAVSCYGVNDRTILRFTSRYFVDSQTVTEDSVEYNVYGDGSRSFKPRNNNNTMLGESTRKWKEVYATNYYYGSNNVEFSTKFVTTDTAQTITGAKTFSDNLTIYNSDDTQTPKGLTIRNAQWGMGESGGTTISSINFSDKNSSIPASVMASKGIYGQSFLRFSVRTKDSQNTSYSEEIYYDIDTSGNVEFRSWHDNSISLGTSVNKWKDVQTKLINGLTPSSLSLPSDRSARVDISGYFTNTASGDTNTYTAPSNGWIYLSLDDVTEVNLESQTSGGLTNYGDYRSRSSNGALLCLFPVRKDDVFVSQWYTTTTVTVTNAYFIPCQGNI